jgi:DnaA-homolog protein
MRQLPLGVRIPDRAVFDNFLAGKNQEAVDHLRRLAQGESAGIVWVCGPAGSGKTHLLQATCVAANASMNAAYFPFAELENLGVEALDGLASLGCVCIDDVERAARQPEWERALFGLYREVDERCGRLVVSAQVPPTLIEWGLQDLASRFAAASIYQLRALDESEQQQALQHRARIRGFELPDETARWLQRRFPRDMHTLYNLLDTLDEAALVAQRRLTIPFIRSVLRE